MQPRPARRAGVPAALPRAVPAAAGPHGLFFPSAITLTTVTDALRERPDIWVGRAERPLGGARAPSRARTRCRWRAMPARASCSWATPSDAMCSARPTRRRPKEVRAGRAGPAHADALRRRDARRARSGCNGVRGGRQLRGRHRRLDDAQVARDDARLRARLGHRHRAGPPRRRTPATSTACCGRRSPAASAKGGGPGVPILYGGIGQSRERRDAAGRARRGRAAGRRGARWTPTAGAASCAADPRATRRRADRLNVAPEGLASACDWRFYWATVFRRRLASRFAHVHVPARHPAHHRRARARSPPSCCSRARAAVSPPASAAPRRRPTRVIGTRQAGNLLTKASWWCGGIFLGLALRAAADVHPRSAAPKSVLDKLRGAGRGAGRHRAGAGAPARRRLAAARHRDAGGAGSGRRRPPPSSDARWTPLALEPRGSSSSRTGPFSRPAGRRRPPPDRRRGRLHHQHDRLSGDLHRSVVPRPDRRHDGADDRQLRRQRRGPRVRRVRRSRAWSCASCRARTRTGAPPAACASGWPQRRVPVLTEVDTRRLTRTCAALGVMRGVIGAGETPVRRRCAALDACPRWKGSTSPRSSPRASRTSGATRGAASRRGVRLRHQAQHPAPARRSTTAG